MKTLIIKDYSTAEDAVKLVIETAFVFKVSSAVEMLLSKFPYSPTYSWFESVFWHIDHITKYKLDQRGKEQIKTPDRFLLNDKFGDCDDYSTLWLALCYRLGIRAFPKIVNYGNDQSWDHIYVIVPLQEPYKGKDFLVLDNVYGKFFKRFNQEVQHLQSRIFQNRKRKYYGTFE